jgi:gamma-glutamylcyclotransferase (GGCT)/AIG2-like uncharacterized protein YtfP
VEEANAGRWRCGTLEEVGNADTPEDSQAERRLEELFGTGRRLAIYGTLAPGQPNHHVVTPLGGGWTEGLVEGELFSAGWGASLGYPGLRPRAGGESVVVHVLNADSLADAWPDLDGFEGPGYRRILVPVFDAETDSGRADERRLCTVANLYSPIEAPPEDQ